uniref:Uncharacterized protein n=1 Tax=Moschus moschiferus TaxID=68415 RepID=A0A8C6DAZ3_MOSMO
MVWIVVFLWRGQNCRILEQVGKFHQDHLEAPIKNQLGHRCGVLPALQVLQVPASYWSLLMLPRVLPPDLKALNDQYVKDDKFRKHGTIGYKEAKGFLQECYNTKLMKDKMQL